MKNTSTDPFLKLKLFSGLTKYRAMKTYGEVEV
jgi:hypothetical protein